MDFKIRDIKAYYGANDELVAFYATDARRYPGLLWLHMLGNSITNTKENKAAVGIGRELETNFTYLCFLYLSPEEKGKLLTKYS